MVAVAGTEVRVLIVDDNPILRMGVRSLLESSGIDVVGEASDGAEGIAKTHELCPDVVLLDVRMPGTDGLTAVAEVSKVSTVVMLTSAEEAQTVRTAMSRGAAGYLVHGEFGASELASAVRSARSGAMLLSPVAAAAVMRGADEPDTGANAVRDLLSERQIEIMELIAQGRSNREIARICYVTEKTVKNHVNHIFARIGARTRAEAVAIWTGRYQHSEVAP